MRQCGLTPETSSVSSHSREFTAHYLSFVPTSCIMVHNSRSLFVGPRNTNVPPNSRRLSINHFHSDDTDLMSTNKTFLLSSCVCFSCLCSFVSSKKSSVMQDLLNHQAGLPLGGLGSELPLITMITRQTVEDSVDSGARMEDDVEFVEMLGIFHPPEMARLEASMVVVSLSGTTLQDRPSRSVWMSPPTTRDISSLDFVLKAVPVGQHLNLVSR